MVYLCPIKKQLHLERPHQAFSFPGLCLELLTPFPIPETAAPELTVRPGLPDPGIMDPDNETVVIAAAPELAQGPQIAFCVFFHNGSSVPDFFRLFNSFYSMVNANPLQQNFMRTTGTFVKKSNSFLCFREERSIICSYFIHTE